MSEYKSLCERLNNEITRLRADLAAVTEERDRLREALKLALEYWGHRQSRYKNRHPVWVLTARAALEGVTKPANTQTGER